MRKVMDIIGLLLKRSMLKSPQPIDLGPLWTMQGKKIVFGV